MKKLAGIALTLLVLALAWHFAPVLTQPQSHSVQERWFYAWDPATDKYWAIQETSIVLQNSERHANLISTSQQNQTKHSYYSEVIEFCCLRDHILEKQEMEQLAASNENEYRQRVQSEIDRKLNSSYIVDPLDPDEIFTTSEVAMIVLPDLDPSTLLDGELDEVVSAFSDFLDSTSMAHLAIVHREKKGWFSTQTINSWNENIPRAVIFQDQSFFDLRRAGARHPDSKLPK